MSAAYPEHAIRCPWCGVAPGIRCTTRRGRPLSIASHDARRLAFVPPAPRPPTGPPVLRIAT